MSDLTVIILTKNEELNIEACVLNAKQVTDDVLVIDSGSTDRTVELAEKCGARVVFRAWDNDFSAQRNFGLTQTKSEWVLYLDADERMNEGLIEAIKKALVSKEQNKYVIIRKIKAFGFEYKYGIFKPDKVTRLFPNNKVTWVQKVHERPVCDLPEKVLAGWLDHYTYVNWQQWWEKAGRYTTIWAEDQYNSGKRIGVGAALTHGISGFFKAYIFQGGFLDGWAGVYSTFQHVAYTMMKYLKLYELSKK